jgi:hypothetical protein
MRTALAAAAGVAVGVLLAGITNAALISMVPPQLRTATLLWTTTGVVVIIAAAASWFLFARWRS